MNVVWIDFGRKIWLGRVQGKEKSFTAWWLICEERWLRLCHVLLLKAKWQLMSLQKNRKMRNGIDLRLKMQKCSSHLVGLICEETCFKMCCKLILKKGKLESKAKKGKRKMFFWFNFCACLSGSNFVVLLCFCA